MEAHIQKKKQKALTLQHPLLILTCFTLLFTMTGCASQEETAEAKVQANKEEFIRILRSTGRPGMESVISHLDTTDFFTRGAGRHHTEAGGLVQHSLETYRIMRCVAWFQRSDSIKIVALFHDMGKIDYGGWHPWRSVKHLQEWGLELTPGEFHAIFYHHKPQLRYFRRGLRRSLTFADVLSTGWWRLWHKAPEMPETPDEAEER